MKPKYISLDNETGGLTKNSSLLTTYFSILDENFVELASLELYVKPDDGEYKVSAEALAVNKINLIEHDKIAVPYSKAGTLAYDFLNKVNPNGEIKLIPLGHNVTFDIEGVCNFLINKGTWGKFVGYRVLDTATIGQFLIDAKLIPSSVSASLGSLQKYFNINLPEEIRHTSKGDVDITVMVYRELKFLVEKLTGVQSTKRGNL